MITVFGYIALSQTLVAAVLFVIITVYIFKFSRQEALLASEPARGRPRETRRQRQAAVQASRKLHAKTILKSITVPTIILVGLTVTRWLTAETVAVPNGIEVNTNRVDAHFCQAFNLLQCTAIRIRCDEFKKIPDGRWRSSPDATLVYPNRPGSFGNNVFGPHAINENGIDLAVYIDKVCGPHAG